MILLILAACKGEEPPEESPPPPPPGPLDVLLVLDDGATNVDTNVGVALAIGRLGEGLGERAGRIGVTTSGLDTARGALLGGGMMEASDTTSLQRTILCEATCYLDQPESDPDYTCGDPVTSASVEALDCLCGLDGWKDHCSSGPAPLEAVLVAICRAGEGSDATEEVCSAGQAFDPENDPGTNAGLVRPEASLAVALFTDRGDASPRVGGPSPEPYPGFTTGFLGYSLPWAVAGPDYSPGTGEFTCNRAGATTDTVRRVLALSDAAGLPWWTVEELYQGAACVEADHAATLSAMGSALAELPEPE